MHDAVYFLKDSAFNAELKYSLRSIEKNLPHNKVIFYGGKPLGLTPDKQFLVNQKPGNKWLNVSDMLYQACLNDEITESFWLMNDDFFVLSEPIADCFSDGDISQLCSIIQLKNRGFPTKYTKHLEKTAKALENEGYVSMNFELHCPMLINRKEMLKVYDEFPGVAGHRSLYGNVAVNDLTGVRWGSCNDHKIVDLDKGIGDWSWFVSTEDRSFAEGKVGKEIRALFPEKSRFEH